MNIAFPLIIVSIFINTAAQLLLKAATDRVGEFSLSLANFFPVIWQFATNPYLISGVACYVLSMCVWLVVLSRIQVSVAYPLMSIGFIINAIAAHYLLGESLNLHRVVGIIVIIAGVYLVARSA